MFDRRGFLTAAGACVGGASTVGAIAAAVGGMSMLTGVAGLIATDHVVQPAGHTPTPGTWDDNGITLAWLGHSSVLINFYGVRILTDPVLFPRIGVNAWVTTLGLLRLTSCALAPSQLPEIDLVLVSHAHFDHLDTRSLGAIRGRPVAVMAPATSDLLPRRRYRSVNELAWEQWVRVETPRGGVEVRAIQVKHWGARLGSDTHRGYNGYVIRREGRSLLFGGDTAYTRVFASHRQHGPFDAAIMPIGAYDPWIFNHCTPEQAVAMADAAGARLFVPVHHRTFRLSHEPFDEPIARADAALAADRGRLVVRHVGETTRIV